MISTDIEDLSKMILIMDQDDSIRGENRDEVVPLHDVGQTCEDAR